MFILSELILAPLEDMDQSASGQKCGWTEFPRVGDLPSRNQLAFMSVYGFCQGQSELLNRY